MHRRGAEYAEIFYFQNSRLGVLSASAVRYPNRCRTEDRTSGRMRKVRIDGGAK
jgi:hypothetical protein